MPDALVIALAVLAGAVIGASLGTVVAAWFFAASNADRRDRSETFQR